MLARESFIVIRDSPDRSAGHRVQHSLIPIIIASPRVSIAW